MSDLILLCLVASAVFAVAALAQAVSGFGGAMVAIPLLLLVVDPATAIVGATGVSLVLSARAWRQERAHVDGPLVRRLVLSGVVGLPFGLAALLLVDEHVLGRAIGVLVLVTVAATVLRVRLPATATAQRLAGTTSGALLASTGMNGPPLVLAMLGAELPPRPARGTLQAVFTVQDAAALVLFAVTGVMGLQALAVIAAGCVGVPVGWAVGDRAFHRLTPEAFRRVVLVGLVAVAVTAFVPGG